MGKNKPRSRKIPIIILRVFFICIFLVLDVYFLVKYLRVKKENALLNENLEICQADNNNYKSQIEEIKLSSNNTKENLKRIDEIKDSCSDNIRNLEEKILKDEADVRIAYITVDDGPYDMTYDFLDTFNRYDVTATFFVLLKENRYQTYLDILKAGHTIGNHTASHKLGKSGIYSSTSTFLNDFHKLHNYLVNNFNYTPTLYRFPGGSPTAGKFKLEIADTLRSEGYNYVDWNVIVGDGSDELLKQKRPYEWFREQINGKKIAVILMHDYSVKTRDDLPEMLEYLKNNNFIVLPLTNKSIMVN